MIYLKELILTSFSLFYLKCKKFNLKQKTSGNAYLGHLREWAFPVSPRLHLIMDGVTWYLLEIWWIVLQH